MTKIVEEKAYDGAPEKIERLGLQPLLEELRAVLTGFSLLVKEERDANGGAFLRKLIDEQFEKVGGWVKKQSGGIDWQKCLRVDGTRVCLGVEIQVSGRSDMIAVDLIHLKDAIVTGSIDAGVVVVPSDRLGRFLTDRGPRKSEAERHLTHARVEDTPLILIVVEHDGPGPALAKQAKRV